MKTAPLLPTQTPRELGYRMPAEWERHAATWFSWPRFGGQDFPETHPERFAPIPTLWAHLTKVLSKHEQVHINYFSPQHKNEILTALEQAGLHVGRTIQLHHFPAYQTWCRDHGPTFVTKPGGIAIVDWDYNAWGGKYPPFDFDDEVPERIADWMQVPCFQPGIVMEGGSLEVNGTGTLLTTESCLLNPNRNPHLSRDQIEQYLRDYLSVDKILWLTGEGIVNDDTDGHIDVIARFVNETTVLAVAELDPADPNYAPLQENHERLRKMTTAQGQPLEVISLPMPEPVEMDGQRWPATYANFYIANDVVLLPTYRQPRDKKAQEILQQAFPSRQIIPIDSVDLIWGQGSFHCITQQQPAVPAA